MSRRRRPTFLIPPEFRLDRRGRKAARKEDLTDELVTSLVPGSREYAVHDLDQPGLFVRVRPTGSKTYYYRPQGRKKAVSLGSANSLTVADARLEAHQGALRFQRGESLSSLSSHGGAETVRSAFDAYLERIHQLSDGARIQREFTRVILPAIGDSKLAEISRDQVETLIDQLPTFYARRNRRVIISAFLSWCVGTGRIDYNILKGGRALLRPEPRERMRLSSDDLWRVWQACDELPPVWRDAFRLVIASGLTIREVLQLPSNAGWRNSDEELPFGPLATELLAKIERPAGPNLFAAPGKWSPRTFQQGILRRLQETADIGTFTASDLSRASKRIASIRRVPGLEWDDLLPPLMRKSHPSDDVVL